MGWSEKKVLFQGKWLEVSEVNFPEAPFYREVFQFAKTFLDEKEVMEVRTSGSTGIPKTITIPKKYMLESARATLQFLHLNPGDKILLCMHPRHIGGAMMIVRWLAGDLDLYLSEPQANPLAELKGEVDMAAMVPYQVQASVADLGKARKLLIGGGAVPPGLEDRLKQSGTEIYQTFGMTETISHIALRRINGKSGVYQALPNVTFTADEESRLIIDAPGIGVRNLRTHDVVRLHSPQSFEWLGRADNVVNSGGIKLHPEKIEEKIGPLGFEYFLAGIPDPKLGEKLVMIAEHPDANEEEILDNLDFLPKYEKPKKVFFTTILKTSNGKIRRKETLQSVAGSR